MSSPARLSAGGLDHDPDPNVRPARWAYPLGTDGNRPRRLQPPRLRGAVSLVVGFIPMAVILLIGVPIGLAAGYAGGATDNLLMRITDVVYAFPALLFFIIMQISFRDTPFGPLAQRPGAALSHPLDRQLDRGRAARPRRNVGAEKQGIRDRRPRQRRDRARIIGRHILPNALGPIIVAGAFIVPGAIISEAVLSYLGIGIRPDVSLDAPFPTSWGQMILDGSKRVAIATLDADRPEPGDRLDHALLHFRRRRPARRPRPAGANLNW